MSNGPPLTGLDRISQDFRPTLNKYACRVCGHYIITKDRDEGTTPFAIDCPTNGCSGALESCFYRVSGDPPPTFIWRKPTKDEYRKASRAMKQHFDMGGLDIHPLASGESSECTQP